MTEALPFLRDEVDQGIESPQNEAIHCHLQITALSTSAQKSFDTDSAPAYIAARNSCKPS
jgi:hypothetical protein